MTERSGIDASERMEVTVSDRDFVMNSIWEGTGDELHYNDLVAAKTPYGGRILSGIAAMCLSVAEIAAREGWRPPAELDWSFEAPVYSGDRLTIDVGDGSDARPITVSVGSRLASRGRVRFAPPAPLGPRQPADLVTKGRTITRGDREAFDWWLSASVPAAAPAPPDLVPWPLVASAVSGFVSRVPFVKTPHTSLVNRSDTWRFARSLRVGETIHAEIRETTERPSRSRQGWGIWTGKVATISDSEGDVVADTDWVVMYV